ncbi:hypothetical protein BSLA_03f0553 [Burkholderia stabilis]|nr:hypothetical protein BSLA_03f0553 [Burkholderia stabilis]
MWAYPTGRGAFFGSGDRPEGKEVEKHAELPFNIGLYFR